VNEGMSVASSSGMSESIELSVVVPVFNEEESIAALVAAVRSALAEHPSWELVLVDDGSTDATPVLIAKQVAADRRVRNVRLAGNFGQTAAMQAGFDNSSGRAVVTMDGDLQNDPRDIPVLLAKLSEGYDLVTGYRLDRKDTLVTRKLPSWIANRVIRRLTGVPVRDNGCSLKAYTRELLDRLHLYGDMHRFIPAVAAAVVAARIAEVPVRHHPRRFGRSKYGLWRIFQVLLDLLKIQMIHSFRERPLALFGRGAIASALLGVLFSIGAVIGFIFFPPAKMGAVVLPGAALLWFGLGWYLLMVGLAAEALLREARQEGGSWDALARELTPAAQGGSE
jgi:glycosyltransferase involved in cell wall biosynthesis